MYNPCAPMKGVPVEIMTEEAADETLSVVLTPGQGIRNHTFILIANSDTPATPLTAGNLVLETAENPEALGGWAPLGGSPVDLTTIVVVDDNGRIALNFTDIMIGAVRARISDAVTGGTLSVIYIGQ